MSPSAYDIHVESFCFSHFTVIFLVLDHKSRLWCPVMSPWPNFEALMPPKEKGSRGTGTPMLTPTMPAEASRATRSERGPLDVKTLQAFPYSMLFSIFKASVKSLQRTM